MPEYDCSDVMFMTVMNFIFIIVTIAIIIMYWTSFEHIIDAKLKEAIRANLRGQGPTPTVA